VVQFPFVEEPEDYYLFMGRLTERKGYQIAVDVCKHLGVKLKLAGQGEALVQKGAVTRAKENLARIEKICINACPEQTRLASAIDKGAAQTMVSAQAVTPTPSVSATVEKKPD
jgi:glycosyltransferase involved in cell wall biosynthesis